MKKFTKILSLALLALSMSSCLKDKGYDDGLYGINEEAAEMYKIINIPSTNTTLTTSSTYSHTDAANKTLTIPVHLSAKEVASESLNVSLAVDADDTKINAYNATLAAASRYTRMPAAGYTLNSGTATIPAGSRDASTTVTIKPSSLAAGRYIIPLSITGVDKSGYTISGNQGYRLILVIIT